MTIYEYICTYDDMDIHADTQHEHKHAAWTLTWKCSIDMDMHECRNKKLSPASMVFC
jgi:hypothetical protein